MAKSRKLPGDYAIDALSLEVERRKKKGDYRCSYGKLVADTTPAQRKEITEQYRRELLTGKVGGVQQNRLPGDRGGSCGGGSAENGR